MHVTDEQFTPRPAWVGGFLRTPPSLFSWGLRGLQVLVSYAFSCGSRARATWSVGLLLVLLCAPHVAAATESVIELSEERAAPCCPLEAEAPPEPEDCSRTCRACHCCLPVLVLGMLVPEVSSPVTTLVSKPFAAQIGGLLPAHTRTLFRPPAA